MQIVHALWLLNKGNQNVLFLEKVRNFWLDQILGSSCRQTTFKTTKVFIIVICHYTTIENNTSLSPNWMSLSPKGVIREWVMPQQLSKCLHQTSSSPGRGSRTASPSDLVSLMGSQYYQQASSGGTSYWTTPVCNTQVLALWDVIEALLSQGVFQEVTWSVSLGFYSHLFLVPNPGRNSAPFLISAP